MNQYKAILKILNKEFKIHRYKDVFINTKSPYVMPYLIRIQDEYLNWWVIGKIWRIYQRNTFKITIESTVLTEQQKNKLKLIGFNDKDGFLSIGWKEIFI